MKTFGIILIVLSFVFWAALGGVPFLPVSLGWKGVIVTALLIVAEIIFLIAAEIIFWLGCFMAGAEWARKAWERFAGKFKKKPVTRSQ
jgi:hypothetical protein